VEDIHTLERGNEIKDYYQEGYADWNYHVIGKTLNNEKVRIVLLILI